MARQHDASVWCDFCATYFPLWGSGFPNFFSTIFFPSYLLPSSIAAYRRRPVLACNSTSPEPGMCLWRQNLLCCWADLKVYPPSRANGCVSGLLPIFAIHFYAPPMASFKGLQLELFWREIWIKLSSRLEIIWRAQKEEARRKTGNAVTSLASPFGGVLLIFDQLCPYGIGSIHFPSTP